MTQKKTQTAKKFQVIVVGSGIVGLSTAYHLKKNHISDIGLLSPDTAPISLKSAGMASGGHLDNFTRLSHSRGIEFAKDYWHFGDKAFASLKDFCQKHGVEHKFRGRLRFIVSEAELIEAEKAAAQFSHAGFQIDLHKRGEGSQIWSDLGPRVLAVQDEGTLGGFVSPASLLEKLETLGSCERIHDEVVSQKISAAGVELATKSGVTYKSEMVVFATHLETASFVPSIREAFVSVAEQWEEFDLGEKTPDFSGIAFSSNHSLEWGVFSSAAKVHFGGGRYLRPSAGFEAKEALINPKITEHLKSLFLKTFPKKTITQNPASQAGLDCRPCDELSIIGPMFGESRLLFAAGFMGSGLTQGFLAGKALAEIVATGKTASVPSFLFPSRLRSIRDH